MEATPTTRSVEGEIRIAASPELVWRALTDADELVRWFPLDARVVPGEGGTLWMSWKNEFEAESKILLWDPAKHLRTSWGWDGEQAQVTDYILEKDGDGTVLRVVTSGFPADSEWDEWVEGTRRGWSFELRSLQLYLERHQGESRHQVYLLRDVPLARAEVATRLDEIATSETFPEGERFDVAPGTQYATLLSDPEDGLFRVNNEPDPSGGTGRTVMVWVSYWGDSDARMKELTAAWGRRLETFFPEGKPR